MDNKATIQHNRLMQLENSMLMYGIYSAEILEKLINTVHNIHNTTSSHERLFAGQHSPLTLRSLYNHSLGLHHYSINSLLYLRTIQDKYIMLYRELISQLHIYAPAIRILVKGYLPNTLVTTSKLKEILTEVRKMLHVTNPDYYLVIDRLHLYYDMQLVTFVVDKDTLSTGNSASSNLDQNARAHSYTHLQVKKPYIALNSEMYISLLHQEMRTCK